MEAAKLMTPYKILAPNGKAIATLSCESINFVEGKNRFEVFGMKNDFIGIFKLAEQCRILTVGKIGDFRHA